MFAGESSYKKAPAGTGATERSLEFILESYFFVYFPSNLERFSFEKGETRGGDTAPPGVVLFSAKRRTVWFEMRSVSN